MRALIVNELYQPHVGGQEYRAEGIAGALTALGWSVTVACVNHDPATLDSESEGRHGELITRYRPLRPYLRPGRGGRSLSAAFGFSMWVRRQIRASDFDLVFLMQWPLVHGLVAPTDRTIFDWCEIRDSAIFRRLAKRVLSRIHTHTVVNPVLTNRLSSIVDAPHAPTFAWLPSGADAAPIEPRAEMLPPHAHANSEIRMLFLGRLFAHKRPELAVAVARRLKEQGRSVDLQVVGGGPLESAVRAASGDLPFVHVAGAVDDQHKQRALEWANVLILPSKREGLPNVIAEALHVGVPCVVTCANENLSADFVTQTGIGVATNADTGALADAVVEVTSSPKYSDTAYELSSEFDWKRSGAKLTGFVDSWLQCEKRKQKR